MEGLKYLIIGVSFSLIVSCNAADNTAPRVVSTSPTNMSENIDPGLKEISVTFNKQMMDKSWSWAYSDRSKFPIMTGQAYYSDNKLKNNLPVKLESNKTYEIWINTPRQQNFKDTHGNAAIPFKFTFKTRQSKN